MSSRARSPRRATSALEMLDLFNRLGDPNLQMLGQWSLGAALFHLGELEVGHEHLTRGLELYQPGVSQAASLGNGHRSRASSAGASWRGRCRCAGSRTRDCGACSDAVAEARALEHPQPLAFALLFSTDDPPRAPRAGRRCCGVYDELVGALPRARHRAGAAMGRAACAAARSSSSARSISGIDELKSGLDAHTLTRSALLRPYYFVLYAGGPAARTAARRSAGGARRITRRRRRDRASTRTTPSTAGSKRRSCSRGETTTAPSASTRNRSADRPVAGCAMVRAARRRAAMRAFFWRQSRPDEARDVLGICDAITEGRETARLRLRGGAAPHAVRLVQYFFSAIVCIWPVSQFQRPGATIRAWLVVVVERQHSADLDAARARGRLQRIALKARRRWRCATCGIAMRTHPLRSTASSFRPRSDERQVPSSPRASAATALPDNVSRASTYRYSRTSPNTAALPSSWSSFGHSAVDPGLPIHHRFAGRRLQVGQQSAPSSRALPCGRDRGRRY